MGDISPVEAIQTADTTTLVNFDDITVSLPPLDATFCCCTLIDSSIEAHQHLDDCELTWLDGDAREIISEELSDSSSCNSATHTDASAVDYKRKHRESMARLRHKLRSSIASLEVQERQLSSVLRRTLKRYATQYHEPNTAKDKLRAAYVEQVREQLALMHERDQLEASQALRDKYQRLLRRELERTRTFHVNVVD